jgi:signal transduction histidine kinase
MHTEVRAGWLVHDGGCRVSEQALLRRSTTLEPVPASAGAARRVVREALSDVGETAAVPSAELAVSELVTNAILHAATPLELSIEVTVTTVTVWVRDWQPRLPVQRDPSDDATTGRGLAIVAALAEEHGIDPRPPIGKAVWFRLPRGKEAAPGTGGS